ncbi:MAG: cation:proton antiporter [Methanobacteriaceae archaeon]
MYFIEEVIRTIALLISSVLILIASIGILRLNNKLNNVIYARIHILGVIDIACILAFIALGQPLLAVIYFILAPFLAHAMANAFYYGEDKSKGIITEITHKETNND